LLQLLSVGFLLFIQLLSLFIRHNT
jgi:hypothetical protein